MPLLLRSPPLTLLLMLWPAALQAQEAGTTRGRVTVSGYVQDAETGEKLLGATVYAPAYEAGTATNRYGFYSLTLPAGDGDSPVRLLYSYTGYADYAVTLPLRRDTALTVELAPASVALDSLVVEGTPTDRITRTTRMSTVSVPVADIEALPTLAGEVDVLRTLQLLPGVQGGKEGTSGLYVRGGGPSQNLILLDGTPVYNASHLFGFLSVFNSDAIKTVELTKGGFPARYGGRLSSVIDIRMKEGNLREYTAQGSVGLVASRLTVEGPIAEDRTAFMVSGRRTYADLIARPLLAEEGEKPVAYFYDLNAKLNHVFSERDRVYLSLYAGDDRFGADYEESGLDQSARLGWGNVTAALRWNHLFSDKLFANTALTYSRYLFDVDIEDRFEIEDGAEGLFALRYRSGIRDWSVKTDFDFVPSPAHYVRFGAGAVLHDFRPGALTLRDNEPGVVLDTTFASEETRALELSAYAEDDVRLSERLKLNAGVHLSAFRLPGRTYGSVQPRLSARYRLSQRWLGGRWALKASAVTMRQYIHLLSNAGVGLPTDLWVPATARVRPQRAWQTAAGLAGTLGEGRYEVSLEGYYKAMDGLITYEQGAVFADPTSSWQDKVLTGGAGTSYGVELFVQRKTGRTTGWLGYTLAWTDRKFDGLNRSDPYAYRYDRRHDLSLAVSHRASERFDLSAAWVYATGHALTLPSAEYASADGGIFNPNVYDPIYYYGERNGFRMPAYHRLDLSATYYFSRQPSQHALSFSVYNAYNHKNPFFVDLVTEDGERKLKGFTLFPVLPSLSYRFAF